MPFIRNFPTEEYRANQQNWDVVQDHRGVFYFANNDGIMEYDGVSWRLIKLPGVRSLAVDSAGRVYAGLENDIGYLEPDPAGNWQFISLKEKIPENERDVTTVFTASALAGQVFFQDQFRIFKYQQDEFKVFRPEGGIHRTFLVNNHYFARVQGRGLLMLQNDSLHWIEGSEPFASDRIYAMLPFRQNEILIASRAHGIIIYSHGRPGKFYKPEGFARVDDFLITNQAYCGTILPGGDYAIGTTNGGFIVFSSEGKIKDVYDKRAGLQDQTISKLFSDRNRQLWACLDNGISLIQNNLPFRKYSEQNGLRGTPLFLTFLQNRLYAGTGQYLHVMNPQGTFEAIEGSVGQNFQLIEADGDLLLANNPGILEIKGNHSALIPLTSEISALSFSPVKNQPRTIISGGGDGLYVLEKQGSAWTLKGKISGFDKASYVIVEGDAGNLWVGSAVELFRLTLTSSFDSVVSSQLCSTRQGLPGSYGLPVRLHSGEVVFGTDKGIYRYLADRDSFIPHPDFPMLTGKVTIFKQEKGGKIWFEETLGDSNYDRGILQYQQGKYHQTRTVFNKFTDLSSGGSPENVCIAPDGTIYFGIPSGFLAYDASAKLPDDPPFYTLIRRVFSGDSLLFGGASAKLPEFSHIEGSRIPYSGRDMTFQYASTFYDNPEKILYSYRLTGPDTLWSGWTTDHKKEYTNLREGEYTFEVRSKNQYHIIGSPAAYSFTILPPWYRTGLAYLLYSLLLGSFIYGLVIWRTRKLKARSQELEKIVDERTAQIQEQKNNVEQLSRIGRDITSSLSIENIIHTIYDNVNRLMDASVFTIGLHNTAEHKLEFPAAIEKNETLPPFSIPLSEENRLGAWCFNHRQEVVINDYESEYRNYVGQQAGAITGEVSRSVLYLPLWNKDKVIGVISAQSFSKNAYSDYHVNILRNLAAYSAIALENADAYRRLASLLEKLELTQDMLVTQSKLASLGALTAGIAHEIKNPLNFINNFAGLNAELLTELEEVITREKENIAANAGVEIEEAIHNLKQNALKIQEHGKRADSIVQSMLQHSRGGTGEPQLSDINAILEEAVNLTYHGMRARDKGFNIKIEKSLDASIGKMLVIPQEISRAFLNIVSNGCYEAHRKKLETENNFMPVLSVRTVKNGSQVKIIIRDNGNGIPESVREKLFTPFFTTKPVGQGTGLGLSITWDIIVHQHHGKISFETETGEESFTEFTIQLPGQDVQ